MSAALHHACAVGVSAFFGCQLSTFQTSENAVLSAWPNQMAGSEPLAFRNVLLHQMLTDAVGRWPA